jgi:hypothetical protein
MWRRRRRRSSSAKAGVSFDLLHTLKLLEAWHVSVIAMKGLAFDLGGGVS